MEFLQDGMKLNIVGLKLYGTWSISQFVSSADGYSYPEEINDLTQVWNGADSRNKAAELCESGTRKWFLQRNQP